MKRKSVFLALGLVLALALGLALAVPAEVKKPEACFDKELCAEKMRYGRQAFSRGDYRSAKAFFRQAVQADPLSAKAWAYYDLSIMYDVADQVKKAGSVKVSGAPVPGTAPAAPAPETKTPPPPAPEPAKPSGGIAVDDEGC